MVVSETGDAEALRSPSRLGYRVPAFPGRHRRARMKVAALAAAEASS
jgi:hypothetical protein